MNPLDALLADEEKKKQVMKLYGLGMPLRQGAEAAPLTQPAPAPVTAPKQPKHTQHLSLIHI